MLPLLLLLVLSSASPQDQPADESVSSLNLDPAHDSAEIVANVSVSTVRRDLAAIALKHKRQVNVMMGDADKLRWVTWGGSLPNGVVSIYNSYAHRIDYVCKYGCHSGFYNPSKGPYCHYAYYNEEHRSSSFDVLVNEDNFQVLVWKEGSYGSVPQNSVSSCSIREMYVGKNKYGLGKVDVKNTCFFLPWEGKEYWYKYYEVLTRNLADNDLISDVRYHTDQTKILKTPPKTLQSSTTANYDLSPVTKTVSLTKTTTDQRRWDISSSITFGVRTSIKTGIPFIVEGNIEIGTDMTHTFSGGNTWTEQVSHKVELKLTVPSNHSCTVKMVGYQYTMDIPFTARLKRTYEDGETRSVIISGTYHGVQVGEVRVEVKKCKPF